LAPQTIASLTTSGLPVDLRIPKSEIGDGEAEAVTAFDMIEHVAADAEFLLHLVRVAWRHVFLTTPNWHVSRGKYPYHVREYTPGQLEALCASTVAILAGRPGTLVSYDRRRHPLVDLLEVVARPGGFRFAEGDSLTAEIEEIDLLFLDAVHMAHQLWRELSRQAGRVRAFFSRASRFCRRARMAASSGRSSPSDSLDARSALPRSASIIEPSR
jgi:hypothetical protein